MADVQTAQIVIVPRADGEQEETLATPAVPTHAQLSLTFSTIASFSGRAKHFYRALADIAAYLPADAPSCQPAREMVSNQRMWMFRTGKAVGNLVGTFYMLEMNTLKELKRWWSVASGGVSPLGMVKNCKATHRALVELETTRDEALTLVSECRRMGSTMAAQQGTGSEQVIEDAVFDVISQYGGSSQCKALLTEQQEASDAVMRAEDAVCKAAKSVTDAHAHLQELSDKAATYEAIAEGKKGNHDAIFKRAQEIQQQSLQESQTAAETNKTPYRSSLFRFWYWESGFYTENQHRRAEERAQQCKAFAQEVKALSNDCEQQRVVASDKAAQIKGELKRAQEVAQDCEGSLRQAEQKLSDAKAKLRELQAKGDALKQEHGGLDLMSVATLRDHMQEFAHMLGQQGSEDAMMLSAIHGALVGHKNLCNAIADFVQEDNPAECMHLVKQLKPQIKAAIDDATFFSQTTDALNVNLSQLHSALKDGPAPPQALPAPAETASEAGSWTPVDFEDDPLW